MQARTDSGGNVTKISAIFFLVFLPNRNTLLLIFFVSQCYVTLGKLKITDSYSRVD